MNCRIEYLKKVVMITGGLLAIIITGCAHLVSYYDAVSYKNLTDLKGEIKIFLDACSKTIAKGDKSLSTIDSLLLTSAKAYEYEKGKQLNDDTIAQWEIIDKTRKIGQA